ncbi:MAG: heme o synthase [Terriglobia bacterium]|jgi:protoheme IX farnesyltransferase|nr:heme o synthase [Terriglobia bacterium]
MSSISQAIVVSRGGMALLRDYSELVKARITMLIVISAWCGFYCGAARSEVSSLSWTLVNALLGIALVSAGTAGMNEVMERDIDARMQRTARRPLVTQTMSVQHAALVSIAMIVGGTVYLGFTCNILTAALTFATSFVYLGFYTPLKTVSPICTFIGAIPGAMPPVLGWAAVRGRLDWEAFVLFAILFFWQFPHFHSIALLYRDDYRRAGIRMLPVVERSGRTTADAIVFYSLALLAVTLAPTLLGMTGYTYFFSALVLGLWVLMAGLKIWRARLDPDLPEAKVLARNLLKTTVFYLPLLFAIMMLNIVS